MSSNIKRTVAGVTALMMALSLSACGKDSTWAATSNGEQVPAGMYIFYLQSAYYDAVNQLEADEDGNTPDVFTQEFDGVDAKTWIQNEATNDLKRYCAIEQKCDEYGITLESTDTEAAELYVEQLWEYYGSYYEEEGISMDSYLKLYLNSLKSSMLFEALYSEGGDYAVSDDELKTYLDENYAMINYIEVELRDGEGNLLKSDGKDERRELEQEYIDRYNNGEDFDLLNADYTAWYDNLIAEAEAAAAEAEAAEEETDAALETAEVEESDAQTSPDEDEDQVTEDTAERSETEDIDEEPAETEETAEEEAAEESEEASEAEAADTEELTEDTSEEETEVESNLQVIAKSGTTPTAAVVTAVFDEMEKGEIRIVEGDEVDYIVVKLDVLETDEYYLTAKESLLSEMKWDEYDALVDQWAGEIDFQRNQKAYDRYDPEKLFG